MRAGFDSRIGHGKGGYGMPDDSFKRLFAEFLELESKLRKLDFCLKDSNVGGGRDETPILFYS